ncbi:hypothetical protein BJ138DRAFT_852968 [Hygrophoropsis aurantiaca]|uniref:Uncharacterized protein n=1 Tax=Hygrophoropsis aurantiaca TaxID=72124 RepID=A0ACB7ZVB0_9AGAM|nr:hypothetical protein BJ138DRAFT_852968 [Hygrophoropsis aurantiaca]
MECFCWGTLNLCHRLSVGFRPCAATLDAIDNDFTVLTKVIDTLDCCAVVALPILFTQESLSIYTCSLPRPFVSVTNHVYQPHPYDIRFRLFVESCVSKCLQWRIKPRVRDTPPPECTTQPSISPHPHYILIPQVFHAATGQITYAMFHFTHTGTVSRYESLYNIVHLKHQATGALSLIRKSRGWNARISLLSQYQAFVRRTTISPAT